jgi:type II secretory pathway pseudopilin PulG
LVELLVVITIIGMLMGLLFPALGAVMGQVELLRCSNNLSQYKTAFASYKSSHGGKWPVVSKQPVTGIPGAVSADGQAAGYSWTVSLLPSLGETVASDEIGRASNKYSLDAFDSKVVIASSDGGGDSHFSTWSSRIFYCPAVEGEHRTSAREYDGFSGANGGSATTNYVAISGTHLTAVLGTGNDSPNAGRRRTGGRRGGRSEKTAAPAKPNGVIIYQKTGVSTIRDGDTQTVVLTETREPNYSVWADGTTAWVVGADPNNPEPRMVRGKLVCDEGCTTAMNVGPESTKASEQEVSADDPEAEIPLIVYRSRDGDMDGNHPFPGDQDWQYGPSSLHAGSFVNHLFADGHVKPIDASGLSDEIDATLYMQMITRDGRETIQIPE